MSWLADILWSFVLRFFGIVADKQVLKEQFKAEQAAAAAQAEAQDNIRMVESQREVAEWEKKNEEAQRADLSKPLPPTEALPDTIRHYNGTMIVGALLLAFFMAGCNDRDNDEPTYRWVPERAPVITVPPRESLPDLTAEDLALIPKPQAEKVAKIISGLINRVEMLEGSIKRYNEWAAKNNQKVDEYLSRYNAKAKPAQKAPPAAAPKPLPDRVPASDTPLS